MAKKKVNPQDFADGDCICFYCADVNECEYRSRYFCECGHFTPWKASRKDAPRE